MVAGEGNTVKVGKNAKKGQRLDIQDYQEAVSKTDRKMNIPFLATYESLHKALGYDGNLNYKIVQAGLEDAEKMINWADKHYNKQLS